MLATATATPGKRRPVTRGAAGTPCRDPECATGDHGEPWRCLKHKKHRDAKGKKVPCKNPRIAGADFCRMHGANKQARKNARDRLFEAADQAASALVRVLEFGLQKFDLERGAFVHPKLLTAATEILDRAGYPRASKVELTQVEAKRLDVYTDAVVGILRRSCQLAGLDLKSEKVRSAVGQATKEWAEKAKEGM